MGNGRDKDRGKGEGGVEKRRGESEGDGVVRGEWKRGEREIKDLGKSEIVEE